LEVKPIGDRHRFESGWVSEETEGQDL
jgi:hypothetical protein